MTTTYKTYLLLLLVIILPTSCISRLSRPEITGRILDFNGKPVENCIVGETKTDTNGYFRLPAKTHSAFILTELFIMEAPALMVNFNISKQGYELDRFEYFSGHGGGLSKDTKWNLDKIYLKKIGETVDINKIFKDNWKLSFTKSKDTLYLVSENLDMRFATMKNQEFYSQYNFNITNYGKPNWKKALPDDVASREIKLQIQDKNLNIDVLNTYLVKDKKDESLRYLGNWNLAKDSVMTFKTSYNDLNGNFKVLKSDLFFLQLKKL